MDPIWECDRCGHLGGSVPCSDCGSGVYDSFTFRGGVDRLDFLPIRECTVTEPEFLMVGDAWKKDRPQHIIGDIFMWTCKHCYFTEFLNWEKSELAIKLGEYPKCRKCYKFTKVSENPTRVVYDITMDPFAFNPDTL